MTDTDPLLRGAVAAMVEADDVIDALAYLVDGCGKAYPSEAVAVLVLSGRGNLELLDTNSHRADQLELLQIQTDCGPCIDVLSSDSPVIVSGHEALVDRWGSLGEAIEAAGFDGAHAFPMRWHGRAIGGLNIFVSNDAQPNESVGQLYADLATLALVQPGHVNADEIIKHVNAAVEARAVIEQAKGVLAYRRSLTIHEAYDVLVAEARSNRTRLQEFARQVISEQHAR